MSLVPLVKAEAGCLDYGPTVDVASGIPVQGPLREDAVIVVERWQDLDCLRAHLDGAAHAIVSSQGQRPGQGHEIAGARAGLARRSLGARGVSVRTYSDCRTCAYNGQDSDASDVGRREPCASY